MIEMKWWILRVEKTSDHKGHADVFGVVDDLPLLVHIFGTGKLDLADKLAVEKVIMRLIPIAELPDDMVPLIVDDQGGLRTGEVPPA